MILSRFIGALTPWMQKSLRERRIRKLIDRGESLLSSGDADGAKLCYRQALAIDAADRIAHARLAQLLTVSGDYEGALRHYGAAHAAAPLTGDLVESYVRALLRLARHDKAWEVAQAAISADPDAYENRLALGLAALACHPYAEALGYFDNSLQVRPDDAEAHTNRGIALQNLGRISEADDAFGRALAAEPDDALARFHRALVLLMNGNYAAGWPEYEARLASGDVAPRSDRFPRWKGEAPAGRTLLLYGEQGLGDEIMFSSCIPDLVRAGARCVLECNPKLRGLFERSFPEAVVYSAAPHPRVPAGIGTPGIDCEVPLGSLPLYFRRDAGTFPKHRGYLKADPRRIADWRERLATLGGAYTVGISWQGGTHATRSSLRSMPLHQWLPLLGVPGIRFISLQYTPNAQATLRALREGHGVDVQHWPEAIADYDETAALVYALDLTVSVCTSVAHLAGALGRPVWVLVPSNPEWRYGRAGETMPWYPSARLFRQAEAGDWTSVIDEVERGLRRYIARDTASSSTL